MNKKDLRTALKPLIKECIKDILFEEGFLSSIISEVVIGLKTQPVITEHKIPDLDHGAQLAIEQQRNRIDEARKRMTDAIGSDTYQGANLFEGTQPLSSAGNPASGPEPTSPLSEYAPNDGGIDIDSLFGSVGKNWKKLIGKE